MVEKFLNLLFDTFHNVKYFKYLFQALVCYFCVGSSSYPNVVKFLCQAILDISNPL
jgi:hypothetical protein